jgi:transposase
LACWVSDLSRVMTLSDVADLLLLSWDTVKGIVKERLQADYGQIRLKALKYFSIDEIYVGKRGRFYTLVLDLESGRILWVGQGRGAAALQGFWPLLRKSKAKVKAVAMDMSAGYWLAVATNLPEAAIVFDRFHIAKLMGQRIDELRRQMVREAQGAMKLKIKGTRYLLLMRAENLEGDQLSKLDEALRLNEPLFVAWYLKEELILLWEQPSLAAMKSFLKQWCDQALGSGIGEMQKMAHTLLKHKTGILNWWSHRINNGKMEGINNKIKTLTRQAYGYRDEEFFILKLLALHESRYKLLG